MDNQKTPMLELRDIHKSFGDVEVLKGILEEYHSPLDENILPMKKSQDAVNINKVF